MIGISVYEAATTRIQAARRQIAELQQLIRRDQQLLQNTAMRSMAEAERVANAVDTLLSPLPECSLPLTAKVP